MLSNQSNVAVMPQLLAFTFWRRLLTSVIPSREGYADTLYGYNPYHREPTPEEKLAALSKNQEKEKTQPSALSTLRFRVRIEILDLRGFENLGGLDPKIKL